MGVLSVTIIGRIALDPHVPCRIFLCHLPPSCIAVSRFGVDSVKSLGPLFEYVGSGGGHLLN